MFFKAAEVHFQVTFNQAYSLLTLYQNKIRKLKHQSNSFASGGKLKTRTSHSIAFFRAKVYEQRKEHGKLKFYQRRPTLSSTLTGTLNLVCCFCNFTLTRSHKNSNVSRVTRKCSFQRKSNAGLASKFLNQFCGRGQTQALLLRCTSCCFIWAKILSSICLFLRLSLNSSSVMRKWYNC